MNILIVHMRVPEPDTNAGDLRLWEMLKILKALGHKVLFVARSGNHPRYEQCLRELVDSLEVDRDRLLENPEALRRFLHSSPSVAVFSPYTMFNAYAWAVRHLYPECALVLDTIDLFQVRLARASQLDGAACDHKKLNTVARLETRAIAAADSVWAVTPDEARMIMGAGAVSVVPTVHNLSDDRPGFYATSGLIFLGGYQHLPNVDAVQTFHRHILPMVRDNLGCIRITYAGSNPIPEIQLLQNNADGISVPGFVDDHRVLLRSHRVAIAPLRYGAGLKGKVGEYMSCGVPCVLTSIAAEGMELTHRKQAMIADDCRAFATSIVDLYRDENTWLAMQGAGLHHVRERYTPAVIEKLLVAALDESLIAVRRRRRPLARIYRKVMRAAGMPLVKVVDLSGTGNRPLPLTT